MQIFDFTCKAILPQWRILKDLVNRMKYFVFIILLVACKGQKQKAVHQKRWIGDVYVDQKKRKLVILVADKPGSEQVARTYTIDITKAINQATADSVDFSQLTYPCDKGDEMYLIDSLEEVPSENIIK